MKKLFVFAVSAAVLSLGVSSAQAVVLDLTGATSEGFINSALFSRLNKAGSGTGNIEAFVQVENNPTEHAYNTTVNNVLDNKNSDQHNHELLLSAVPLVLVNNVLYREFLLDLAEPGDDNQQFISLDEIQILLSTTPNQSFETFTGPLVDISGTLVYRLDANADSHILLDSTLAGGQGQRDMFAYIPANLFTGANTQYVYLYSRFGDTVATSGAFEEWAVRVGVGDPSTNPVVPEPASFFYRAQNIFPTAQYALIFHSKPRR